MRCDARSSMVAFLKHVLCGDGRVKMQSHCICFLPFPLAAISKLVDTQHKAKKKFSKGEYKIIMSLQIQDLANITGNKKDNPTIE